MQALYLRVSEPYKRAHSRRQLPHISVSSGGYPASTFRATRAPAGRKSAMGIPKIDYFGSRRKTHRRRVGGQFDCGGVPVW
jgi:hypothetical protein